MSKLFVCLIGFLVALNAFAEANIKMSFQNEELIKIIEIYSKASGQKFIIDPNVRGKITIMLPGEVSIEEAFNHLSSALAINGYAISQQVDTMVIKSARNIQRDLIEVTTALPKIKPERMVTWLYKAKNISADAIARELRILNSKDGEITLLQKTNTLIITDWTSNITRVANLMSELDKPIDAATAKLVESYQKNKNSRVSGARPAAPEKQESQQ